MLIKHFMVQQNGKVIPTSVFYDCFAKLITHGQKVTYGSGAIGAAKY